MLIHPDADSPQETVADVIVRLEALSAMLPPGDGVRAFNQMYLVTTRHVNAAIVESQFADPAFTARLDVVFANLFLRAIELQAADPRSAPRCWRALVDARTRRGVSQLQFAIAGMNAHINYDLARALVMTAMELGGGLGTRRRVDYEAINKVLALTQPLVKQELLTGPFALLDHALGDEDDRVGLWGIARAREFAWTTAQTLLVLRGTAFEGSFTEGVDAMVELSSQLLLTPEL